MRSPRFFLRVGAVIGALFTCAPLLGLAGTMLGVNRTLAMLGKSGISDPRHLSNAVGEMMLMIAGGFLLFPAGIVLLIICLWAVATLAHPRDRRPLPRFPENSENPP